MASLIGTNPNQVPTNADLGELAYQNKDSVNATGGNATFDELGLKAVAATISDTAVDVFVYDTRKDSDGGAWRKRTQHTSWYNETLNTATRGSRREFPAVAVIVAEGTIFTIYDGDDPALPMWMVFTSNSSNDMVGEIQATSVTMLNGIMCVGNGGSGFDLNVVNFVSDVGYQYSSASNISGTYVGNIAERDNNLGWIFGTVNNIVDRKVNDVAMTVLPNAPIDDATGLPIPTIAVATNGGVSVITDSGAVFDITGGSPNSDVVFTDLNRIAFIGVSGSAHAAYVTDIPTADVTTASFYIAKYFDSSWSANAQYLSTEWFTSLAQYRQSIAFGGSKLFLRGSDAGEPSGLAETDVDALDARITSTYNTGWMNGNIKLATLSDTDATNVTGTELVTGDDSTFTSTTGNWAADSLTGVADATLSLNTNRLLVTNTGADYGVATLTATTEVGKRYTFSVDYTIGFAARYIIRLGTALLGFQYADGAVSSGATTGTKTFTFVATTTTLHITLGNYNAASDTSLWDNVSLRLAEADRSVNGRGLQVFGTVTKTAVNTGNDLVAYSGWSSANYFKAPAIPAFDTGDYFISTWAHFDSTDDNYHHLVSIGLQSDSTGVTLKKTRGGVGDSVYFFGNNTTLVSTGVDVPMDTWVHIAGGRRNGVWVIYINGKLTATGSTNTFGIGGSGITTLTVGFNEGVAAGEAFAANKQALVRLSATFPTAEQIAKIYEDEKYLFQEGAQATLYGSSDAVTALAYDEDESILRVGTSSGRSDFSGLRRVSNTTTGVTTAISSSNGMVVEQ